MIAFPLVALLAGSPLFLPCQEPVSPQWSTDFDAALRRAAETDRAVLAEFTGSDWCPPCKRLKEEVFDTERFAAWAERNVVLVELDFPRTIVLDAKLRAQNEALAKRYSVQSFPSVLLLDAEGKVLGRLGYLPGGPGPFVEQAHAIVETATAAWCLSYEQAIALGHRSGRPVLAAFLEARAQGADRDSPLTESDRWRREIFEKPAFRRWARRKVVLLEVEMPPPSVVAAGDESVREESALPMAEDRARLQRALAQRLLVTELPTILLLDPQNGEVKGRFAASELRADAAAGPATEGEATPARDAEPGAAANLVRPALTRLRAMLGEPAERRRSDR